ncbi:MAG: class I SAM-dependent methyltransferase [Hylemonella sp.]|nr:class I SAM-dependent methyltransferase [Hylemonella sp.]
MLGKILKDVIQGRAKAGATGPLSSELPPPELIESANSSLDSGDVASAEIALAQAMSRYPEQPATQQLFARMEFVQCLAAAEAKLPGPNYLDWLKWFQQRLKPASYVEIGVESGQSLQYAQAPTRAIGIDPALRIVHSQTAWIKLFQLPSDEFFQRHDLRQILGADAVDLAFIDGLHTFDQALKDFMNVERYADAGTIVLFHDIFPVTAKTAERERVTTFWVGDTWKVMMILKKYRPDLTLFTIPTHPSGLGVVTGLKPNEQLLWRDFESICAEAMAQTLDDFPPQIDDHLNLVPNDFNAVASLLDRRHHSA